MTRRQAVELCSIAMLWLSTSEFAAIQAQSVAPAGSGAADPMSRSGNPQPKAFPAIAPAFEVAAIRENQSDHTARSHIISSPNNGRFTAINAPLMMLIQFAFGIPESRILGAPSWISTTKFDIDAKADTSVDDQLSVLGSDRGKAQKRLMLQALLAERFQLRAHPETRELPMYALVVARSGPKSLESKANGTTIDGGNGRIQVQGGENTIALLAEQLANSLGRPVVDQTGIQGRYNITLKWTPDNSADPKLNGTELAAAALDAPAASFFTAIQEQLGLKLEPRKGPVQVLIIDHVERPSAN